MRSVFLFRLSIPIVSHSQYILAKDACNGEFVSIVDAVPESQDRLGQISLIMISGKQRDFAFDYVFDSNSTQDSVYDRIARPVVTDVLKGFNGTIFAYGQTGTGKVP